MNSVKKYKQPTIFLCHATEDKPVVEKIYIRLKEEGLKPWLDKFDLLPGQDWDIEIKKALKSSSFILIFFSKTSISKRGYVQREFKLALDILYEIPEGQIFIIPVRLDDCKIPDRFSNLHYCSLFTRNGFDNVLKSIKTELKRSGTFLFRLRPKTNLTKAEVIRMIKEYDFFDDELNFSGKGINHEFEVFKSKGISLIKDHVTGLIWQKNIENKFDIFKPNKKSEKTKEGSPITADQLYNL